MSARAWIATAALLAAGCAENAVLELVIELPAAPLDDGTGMPWFALVQINRATEAGFGTPREGGETPVPRELGTEPQVDCISVQTKDETMDLELRVRFCRDINCLSFLDGAPPERYFRIEHPFYVGRRTFWSTTIDRVPACTVDADCPIGRCFEGLCGCTADADCCAGGCDCPTELNPVGGTCFVCEDGPDTNPDPDSCVEAVQRCHVEGCTVGNPSMFCSTEGERPHFCEEQSWADRVETYPMACMPD